MPKISIIIPVYNTEKYIRECLESIINQSMHDIEVLCIDDGSTDSSLSILKEYAEKDNRIRIFTQENKGPSAARNLGLDNAIGEYVTFVDSDDWVAIDMCEKTYSKAIETEADIVLSTFYRNANGKTTIDTRLKKIKNATSKETFNFDSEIENIVENVSVETVGKLYKIGILKDNLITFPQSIRLGEDMCFFFQICLQNPLITIMPEAFYYYRINSENSLAKKPDAIKILYRVLLYIKNHYISSKIKNKKKFFYHFLRRLTHIFLGYWNNCYTISYRKINFKYLIYIKALYKKFPHKHDEIYDDLKRSIWEYRLEFWTKLFAPVIEIENRSIRLVIYLFGNQVLNIPKSIFISLYYNFIYYILLLKLRILSHFRKIRVGFWITEPSKWTNQHFYNALKNDKHFEPFILLSYFSRPQNELPAKEYYEDAKEFFKQQGAEIYEAFNPISYKFQYLHKFKPDIIFYQQPWMIDKKQKLQKNHYRSLLCYIPYCFYSMDSYLNYLAKFHGLMWKYFVETNMHKEEYKKNYHAINCVTAGSTKLDSYHFVDKEHIDDCWKTKNKKRIIYAPHHSFNDGLHEVATFKENGKFILELAKSHPETEWIFRPHPVFIDRIIKNSIMSVDEINNYYKEWEKIGTISTGGNYYEMFLSSDALITDCISFLSEYAPTLKPVFHLRKHYQKEPFNDLVSEIDKSYYQIYTNEELKETFEKIIVKGEDSLKEKRENNLKLLPINTLASENIYNYLKKELWI